MTIDEKVVQRFEPRMVGFCDRPPEAGMSVSLHGHYVLHSAYAGLAAEFDALKEQGLRDVTAKLKAELAQRAAESQLAELEKHSERIEVAYLASESRAEDAETQLAEFRGRANALADKWESVLKQMGGKGTPLTDNVIAICVRELRAALAAAEGE